MWLAIVTWLVFAVAAACAAWIALASGDTSACWGCGHEFGPHEEIHVEATLPLRAYCHRCWMRREVAHGVR